MELLGDGVRQLRRPLPHGVVGDRDLILLVGVGPGRILFHDPSRRLGPDGSVGGSDHLDGKVEPADLRQLLRHHGGEGGQDVGVVLHGLLPEQAWIGLAVEELLHRVVLAEGVVGEEDVVAGQKGGHGIGPMEHRHLHEHQALAVADLQGVLGLHDPEIPAALSELPLQAFDGIGGTEDGRLRDFFHQRDEGAGMVALAVVGHDEIDLMEVNLFFQILHELVAVRHPYRIDEDGLLLLDKIGVLAGAVFDGVVVPMKLLQLPIDIPDPAHVAFDMLSHRFPL